MQGNSLFFSFPLMVLDASWLCLPLLHLVFLQTSSLFFPCGLLTASLSCFSPHHSSNHVKQWDFISLHHYKVSLLWYHPLPSFAYFWWLNIWMTAAGCSLPAFMSTAWSGWPCIWLCPGMFLCINLQFFMLCCRHKIVSCSLTNTFFAMFPSFKSPALADSKPRLNSTHVSDMTMTKNVTMCLSYWCQHVQSHFWGCSLLLAMSQHTCGVLRSCHSPTSLEFM